MAINPITIATARDENKVDVIPPVTAPTIPLEEGEWDEAGEGEGVELIPGIVGRVNPSCDAMEMFSSDSKGAVFSVGKGSAEKPAI
jgi:hypothetical protein